MLRYGSTLEKNNIGYALVDGKIFFPIILSVLKEINIKTISLYDLDDESNKTHNYLNSTISSISDEFISFKPNIENYFNITKDMNVDKYRGMTILMNEYYLNNEPKLMDLLSEIDSKLTIISGGR